MAYIKFSVPATYVVSDVTLSGKSFWIYKLLKEKECMFDKYPEKILYCYSVWQPLFDKMKNELGVIFHEGVPTSEEILSIGDPNIHTLICLDDLQHDIVNNVSIEKLFPQWCHHKCISVIFVNQNLFYQGKCSRTLTLNTMYTILLKNYRNVQQVEVLGRQLGKGSLLKEAYLDAISKPYGYLVVDLNPRVSDVIQLRTNIFPDEQPVVIYR